MGLSALALTSCSVLFDTAELEGTSADGAPSVSADSLAQTSKTIFVTSTFFDGNFGGPEGADQRCQERADIANLPGQYNAWLSDGIESPATRFTRHEGSYVLVGGTEVARNWDDLVDGALFHEIARTEFGTALGALPYVCIGGEVWTNTKADGTSASEHACNAWTSGVLSDMAGVAGNVRRVDAAWTEANCANVSCQSRLPLYCVQQ